MTEPLPEVPSRYRVAQVVGAGELGSVLRVHDEVLGLDVAMKVLAAEAQDTPGAAERFRREARLTASLRHPAIVPVHDLGTLADGRPWFTMELLEGHQSLAEAMHASRGAVSPVRTWVQILHDVAEAVGFAHSRGVAHSQISADVIVIGPFGEARLVHWAAAWDPSVDGADGAGGTLAARCRGDVRALGACLRQIIDASGSDPDPDLSALADEAAASEMGRGLADGHAFARRLAGWLDYQRQRDRAVAPYQRAQAIAADVTAARFRLSRLRDELAEAQERTPTWAGVEGRRQIWACEEAVAAAEVELHRLELAQVQYLRASLSSGVTLPEVRRGLAGVYRSRGERAEREGDEWGLSTALAQLATVDDGTHAAWREGRAWLSLESEPSGVEVRARRIEPGAWAHELVGTEKPLGTTPLRRVELSAGSWQLSLRVPGGYPVLLPIFLERLDHLELIRPGASVQHPVWLPPAGAIGPHERYVPAGWFRAGGRLGTDPWPPTQLWVDAFVMRAQVITAQEWCTFLDDLEYRGETIDPVAAADELVRWTEAGFAPVGHPDRPACGFTANWAARYAEWRAARDGLPWRLPHEAEWEKAARAADGRSYPWGDRWDPVLAANLGSGADWADPVGGFPRDRSFYGVEGLAGHVHEYCANVWERDPPDPTKPVRIEPYDPQAPVLAARGGDVLLGPPNISAATRWATRPERVFKMAIRLVRSVP